MPDPVSHPYDALTPDTILDSLEAIGLHPDGGMLALNSYENRVYQIGIEDDLPMVVKFYRPGRWSDEAILEEHRFSINLQSEEIPVIAPLSIADRTLHEHGGFRFSLFPRRGGRWPELDSPDNLEWIGRFLARIHLIGASSPFSARSTISPGRLGDDSARYLLDVAVLPPGIESRYRELTTELLSKIDTCFEETAYRPIRLHGDCHPGNILWTEQGPHFVDMDDCCNGPAIQDIWMLLSGDHREMALQLSYVREGYEMFRDLNTSEIALIEPLRTLRMIHYAAWLARRWDDPAFPRAFPWFGTTQYWQDHINQLEHQLHALDAPPLPLY